MLKFSQFINFFISGLGLPVQRRKNGSDLLPTFRAKIQGQMTEAQLFVVPPAARRWISIRCRTIRCPYCQNSM
jgi:hypothetical protein